MTRVTRRWIPGNDQGVRATLRAMRRAVRDAPSSPKVTETAARIVSSAGGGLDGLAAIDSWARAHFVFAADPADVELLRYPEYQLEAIESEGVVFGDCDDAALLVAALGYASGYPARFVVVDRTGLGAFEHVWAELAGPDGVWYEFDITAGSTEQPHRWEVAAI